MVEALQGQANARLHTQDPGSPSGGPYVIQRGDTLSGIAARYGVTLAELRHVNPQVRDPDLIYAGDTLNLPAHARSGAGDYIVKSGDTLSEIARAHGVSLAALEEANAQILNPDVIYPGEVVHVPRGGSSPQPGGTGSSGPVAAPGAPAPGGDRTREAMDYFVSQGWTAAQAAGLVANLRTESGLRPDARGDGGLAYGIGQWHPDRQAAFQKFTGHAIHGSSFEQQLRFVQYELTHGESAAGNRLHSAASAYDAGATVSRYYERPADREGEASRRGQLAEQILRSYHP
jgi:LysM repeat protein